MSFLFPAFLFGSLAIAIPIVLHLMKREEAPRVPFSDIRFLRRAPATHARRRRLRELLLLAMRVSALLLLVLAFARPFLDSAGVLQQPVTVVALDRSFSMGATGTFDEARAAAQEAITRAPAGHAVALTGFDHRTQIVHEPSTDRAAVSAAVDSVAPGPGATRFADAVSAAVDMIGTRDGHIVIVSDLQQAGWADDTSVSIPGRVTVEVVEVGATLQNLAISAIQTEADRVTAIALNTGPERSTTVSMSVDGQPLASRTVTLPTGPTIVEFDGPPPSLGLLEVSVADVEGYPADDRRFAVLDPPVAARVAVVTADRSDGSMFYLERALLAGESESTFLVVSLAANEVSARDLDEFDAVIVASTDGLERQGRERIAAFASGGGGLFVVAGPSLDVAVVADLLGDDANLELADDRAASTSSFAVTDARHPVFRAFGGLVGTLAQIRVSHAFRVTETAGATVLARFDDGTAALVEYTVPQGRAILFASDLNNEWNDFPRQPMFVPFVHEILRYVVGSRDARREFGLGDLPSGIDPAPGLAYLPGTGDRVVINVDSRESDSERLAPEAFASRVLPREPEMTAVNDASIETDVEALEAEQSYWWYALVAVALLLVGEAWLGRTMA